MNIKSHKAHEEFLYLLNSIKDGKEFSEALRQNVSKETLEEFCIELLSENMQHTLLALDIKMLSGVSIEDMPDMLREGWQFMKVEFNQTNGAKSE